MRLLLDIVGFQITWWACALGAAAGAWEPGVAVAAVVIAVQLWMSKARVATVAAVLAAGVCGVAAETAVVASGLVTYQAPLPAAGLAPIWLVGLWMVFGTCIEATARMLGERRLLLGAALGALLAPPTYWAGASLAALHLAEPIWLPLLVLAAIWAVATPLLMAVYGRAAARSAR